MIYLAIWCLIGIVCAAWDHYRSGDDFTMGMAIISAALGLLVPASIFGWTGIVILRGKK